MSQSYSSITIVLSGEALGALGCFDNEDVTNALTKQSQNPRAEVRGINC
jgi:hypothetical protein